MILVIINQPHPHLKGISLVFLILLLNAGHFYFKDSLIQPEFNNSYL